MIKTKRIAVITMALFGSPANNRRYEDAEDNTDERT
jgi:hypothetical protein